MVEAVRLAVGYVEGVDKSAFLNDKRTQQAVIMNILIIGEAARKIAAEYPEVIYYYHSDRMPLYLLTLYGKGEKADLTSREKQELRRLVDLLKNVNRI